MRSKTFTRTIEHVYQGGFLVRSLSQHVNRPRISLDKYANKDLFHKKNSIWQPQFKVVQPFVVNEAVPA